MTTRFIALILLLAQQSLRARDAAPTVTQAPPNGVDPNAFIRQMMLMGIVVLAFWLLLIAPQRKKAKELATTLKALKAGDKIVTNSGILGVVVNIKDKSLSIRSADTKLEILKSSVQEVLERSGEPGESKS
jgi:preprotein translocase subunit YajC